MTWHDIVFRDFIPLAYRDGTRHTFDVSTYILAPLDAVAHTRPVSRVELIAERAGVRR